MSTTVTAREVYAALDGNLRNRSDLGLRKAVADGVLEPRNPFEPQARRRPQKWFVLLSMVVASLVGCFLYFNFWR